MAYLYEQVSNDHYWTQGQILKRAQNWPYDTWTAPYSMAVGVDKTLQQSVLVSDMLLDGLETFLEGEISNIFGCFSRFVTWNQTLYYYKNLPNKDPTKLNVLIKIYERSNKTNVWMKCV